MRHVAHAAIVTAISLAASAPVAGQCQQSKLFNPDPAKGDEFGTDVALDGDRLVVGVPYDTERGPVTGSAWVFERTNSGWRADAQLLAEQGTRAQEFGRQVDISGDSVIVGAYLQEPSVYFFDHDGDAWVRTARFHGAWGMGLAVAIDGDVAVAGVHGWGDWAGRAVVYRRGPDGWVWDAHLTPSDAHPGHYFGRSVDIEGDTIIVGATDRRGPDGRGSAYVFRHDGAAWQEEAIFHEAAEPEGGNYGRGVAISGDTAAVLVGLHLETERGAVHIYRRVDGAWQDDDVFGSAGGERFGSTVALDGTRLVVGGAGDERYARVYRRHESGTWLVEEPLLVSQPTYADPMAVSIDGTEVALGDAGGDVGAEGAGVAYVFDTGDAVGPDCNENGRCDAEEIREGDVPDNDESGVPDECEDAPDRDGDGFPDHVDNCPDHPNPGQEDCDDDGIGDVCAIAEGLSEDCDENGVPDECDPDCNDNGFPDPCDIAEGRSDDCNENGTPDECELDCNDNGVPDDCDIESGESADCDADGIPDECDVPYRKDDGEAEENYALSPSGRGIIWINQFDVRPGDEIVTALGIVWYEAEPGMAARLVLYDDPDNDGDPADAVVLRVVETVSVPTGPDEFLTFEIPPTIVGEAGDSFFVAATVFEERSAQFPMAADESSPYAGGIWLGAAAFNEDVDIEDLAGLALPPMLMEDIGGPDVNLCLRAYAVLGGRSCIPGDFDGDGVVGLQDLLVLLAAWGDCPPPPDACIADLDGDGRAGWSDVLLLLANWG